MPARTPTRKMIFSAGKEKQCDLQTDTGSYQQSCVYADNAVDIRCANECMYCEALLLYTTHAFKTCHCQYAVNSQVSTRDAHGLTTQLETDRTYSRKTGSSRKQQLQAVDSTCQHPFTPYITMLQYKTAYNQTLQRYYTTLRANVCLACIARQAKP
jgi:hypothetical protein